LIYIVRYDTYDVSINNDRRELTLNIKPFGRLNNSTWEIIENIIKPYGITLDSR
jgi:hypothetical protein